MSEAVTVPRLMMMTLIVSKESLARDRQTQTHTQTWAVYIKKPTHIQLIIQATCPKNLKLSVK